MATPHPEEKQATVALDIASAIEDNPDEHLPSYTAATTENSPFPPPTVSDLKVSQYSHIERLSSNQSAASSSNLTNTTSFKTYAIFNAKSFRTFALWEFKSLSNFTIHAGTTLEDPRIYYVSNSVFTPKTPDVQLHADGDEKGPIVASAKFYNWNGDVTLAVGDGSDRNCHGPSSLPGFAPPIYEEMRKVSVVAHSEYRFSTNLTRDSSRKSYIWKRSSTGKDLCWDYVCMVEQSTKGEPENNSGAGDGGEVVARFENAGLKWKKSGDFRFLKSEGEKWEHLVLVAFLSIREKENRFAAYSNGVCV